MATITLRKSKFDGIQGVLDKLKSSFKDYEASLRELKRTAEGVDSSTCSLEDAINDIASSSDKEKEKVEKIKKLNQKIENFVNTAIQREKAARDKIVEKKNDFYKRYKNLKPDCEKGRLERACEKVAKAAKAAWDWVVEHIDKIIAAIIILAAIIICIVCPAAIVAIIGVIACALSAIMGIADLVCMATHDGKDLATVLAENGHGTLAKIWRGTSIGLDVASIILPVGAGFKAAMTVGGQTFAEVFKQTGKNALKGLKELPKNMKQGFSTFKEFCKSGTKNIMKTTGSKVLSGFKSLTGWDDISDLKNIGKIKNAYGGKLTPKILEDSAGKKYKSLIESGKHWDIDVDNMRMVPKTSKAKDALNDAGKKLGRNIDSIPLTKNCGLIDVDWDEVSMKIELPNGDTITHLGKEQKFNMKNLGFGGVNDDNFDFAVQKFISGDYKSFDDSLRREIYGNPSSRANVTLNNTLNTDGVRYTSSGINKSKPQNNGIYNIAGFTAHENYNLKFEHFVPTDLHHLISHDGGASHLVNEIRKIKNIDHLFVRSGITTLINGGKSALSK